VAVEQFAPGESRGYWLIVSELVSYKQIDYAVRAFSRSGRRLKVVGGGPEYKRLRSIGGASVEWCGRVGFTELRSLYAHSEGLIVPGEEDFGITMVEALASGKPVVALRAGGAVEIVGERGVLYDTPSEESLLAALDRVPGLEPAELVAAAGRYSSANFASRFAEVVGAATR
jgi:glycosyltransferase involved in cell wall biosynthesis